MSASRPTPSRCVTAKSAPASLTYRGYTCDRSAHVYRPRATGVPPALIIAFHAGDFCTGSIAMAAPVAGRLAQMLNAAVLVPAYTLARERPFPAAVEDAYAAVVWARVNAAREHWSPDRVAVLGEEAGGNLAAAVALMARDRGGPPLAAQVLVSPMLDPTLTSGSMRAADVAAGAHSIACCTAAYRRYLPAVADHLHPYAAPAHCSRLSGVAPALIITAESDPLCDEATAYGGALMAAGVPAQVPRFSRVNDGAGAWTAQVCTAVREFLAPLLNCGTHSDNHR